LRAEADAVKIFLIEEDEAEDASELSFVDSILFEAENFSWIQFFLKPRNKQKRNPRVQKIDQLKTCLQPLAPANKRILKQNTS
jgi:hypothetical protein